MKIYHHIDEFTATAGAAVTIGTFDGVHIGHRKIISRLKDVAEQTGGETVILTFFPHPRMILHPEDVKIKLITTMAEKARLLEGLGIDHLIITPFTRDFSNMSPEAYIREFLVERIGTKNIVIGYDHRFGKDRSGGLKDLQKLSDQYGYKVEEIPEQDVNDVAVSSTKTREAILSGDVATARAFLGHPFSLTGRVIKGDQLGRQLGFPTANLFIEESYKLIPADGIYAVEIEIHDKGPDANTEVPLEKERLTSQGFLSALRLRGMAYIGQRPTINGMSRNIEVNIFEFDRDIYGQTVRLDFLHFIRGDQKFDSLNELVRQISRDKIAVEKAFS